MEKEQDNKAEDLLGKALLEYFHHNKPEYIQLNTSYQHTESYPLEIFFQEENYFSDLEQLALTLCQGKVLDIGAGVGRHSLALQSSGNNVTALEISPKCCEVMIERSVKKVINQDIFTYEEEKFDTLLLLMNGIGLVGIVENLSKTLSHFQKIMKPNAQIIFDSSDISYLYDADFPKPKDQYWGEIEYQFELDNRKEEWFKWLYIDIKTLSEIASNLGWDFQVLYEDGEDAYLGRLTKI